ncbi:hypothetical protein OCAR_6510 [Afipia carboxidovorans OM5]|nr:hypothetical protein OCAR_6510 [Afipia carboxidovorans OM5]
MVTKALTRRADEARRVHFHAVFPSDLNASLYANLIARA